jgi:hypothetical protein
METELNYEKTWSGILKQRKETYKRRSEEKEVKQEKNEKKLNTAKSCNGRRESIPQSEPRLTRFGILY